MMTPHDVAQLTDMELVDKLCAHAEDYGGLCSRLAFEDASVVVQMLRMLRQELIVRLQIGRENK